MIKLNYQAAAAIDRITAQVEALQHRLDPSKFADVRERLGRAKSELMDASRRALNK